MIPSDEEILRAIVELADDGFAPRHEVVLRFRGQGERDMRRAIGRSAGRGLVLETARLWDRHGTRVPIGVAVSGEESCRLAGSKADFMVAVEPRAELGEMFDAAGGAGKGRIGQIAVSYDEDRDAAVKRAHEQFRWFGLGWKVMADLPNPDSFDAAARFVSEADVEESIPCGADTEEFAAKIKPFVDAGLNEIGLVQIGSEHQDEFIAWAERALLPRLREL